MIKESILNRKGLKISVAVEARPKAKGLAIIMHGFSAFKEQPQIIASAEAFRKKCYTTLRFDTTNSVGESGGRTEDATPTTYYHDLEDVISWAKVQSWYREPFCLVGHSLGGLCVSLYAEDNPREVKTLIPISSVLKGEWTVKSFPKKILQDWRAVGFHVEESESRPGYIKRHSWRFINDLLRYDIFENIHLLTMPVLIIIGEKDEGAPVKLQKEFYKALPGKKSIAIVKGAGHDFREQVHLKNIENILLDWIDELDS